LTTQTVATIPSNRARTKLGVGEQTTLKLTPPPNCPVTWALTAGNGSLNPSGSTATFTAHDRESTATVRATVNGIQRSVTYTVVEPTHETAVKHHDHTDCGTPPFCFQPSEVGSGMFIQPVTLHPTDVSFYRVQVKEVSGFATNRLGYFEPPFPNIQHPADVWAVIKPGNVGEDTVHFALPANAPRPLFPGTFDINIPVRWRVPTGPSGEGLLPNQLQVHALTNANGTMTATKFCTPGPCVSVSRTPLQ
jgi:hypothetical protein